MLTPEEREHIVEEEALRFHTRRRLEIRETVKKGMILFILIILTAGTTTFFIMKHQRCWFQKGITVTALVGSASTLHNGSAVKCLGIKIGAVRGIRLNTVADETYPIALELFLTSGNELTQKIRRDSTVHAVDPILGATYLDIKPGSPQLPEIQENDILIASSPSPKETIKELFKTLSGDR